MAWWKKQDEAERLMNWRSTRIMSANQALEQLSMRMPCTLFIHADYKACLALEARLFVAIKPCL